MEVCSFCLKSSDSSKVYSLESIEFKYHDWSAFATEVVEEILPEMLDATMICQKCARIVGNFYELQRDICLRVYCEDSVVELSRKDVKDEFGEFSFVPSFNRENLESPEGISTAEDNQMSRSQSLPTITSNEAPKQVEMKREMAEPVAINQENEDELMVDIDEPMDLDDTETTVSIDFSSTSGTDFEAQQSAVLPNTELRSLKRMLAKSTKHGFSCQICSKTQTKQRDLMSHLIFRHSTNQELFRAWVKHHISKSLATSSKAKPKCSFCQKDAKSLRLHFNAHIIRGDVTDADFLSMKYKAASPGRTFEEPKKGKWKSRCEDISRGDKEFIKSQCLASKLGSKNYKCVFCSWAFFTYKSLYSHMAKVHVKNGNMGNSWIERKIDETRETSRKSGNWVCCVCFKVNHSVSLLRSHLKNHFENGEIEFDSQRLSCGHIESLAQVNNEENTQESFAHSCPDVTNEIESEMLEPVVACGLETAQQSTVLPNAELRMLKEMSEETAGEGYPCPYCFNDQISKQTLIRHLVFQHSRNKKLFKAWLDHHHEKSSAISRKTSPKCCVCEKRNKSCANLRYHLTAHIIQGEVPDAHFLSPTTEFSLQAKPIAEPKVKQIKDRDMKKAEILNEKIGESSNWKTKSVLKVAKNVKPGSKAKKYKKIQIARRDNAFIKAQCRASQLEDKVFKCSYCSETFSNYVKMFNHVARSQVKQGETGCSWIKRKLADVQVDADGQRRCFVCEENFCSNSILRNHLKVHLQKRELDFAS